MADIHHRLTMCAPHDDDVFAAIATEVFASASSQGVARCVVVFDPMGASPPNPDRETELEWHRDDEPNRRPSIPIPRGARSASLRVLDGPLDWVGTEIVVELGRRDRTETVVRLSHRHWRDGDSDEMATNTTRWGQLLLGLKRRVETPEPDDTRL